MIIKAKFYPSPVSAPTYIIDMPTGASVNDALKHLNIDLNGQPIIAGVGDDWILREGWNTPANDTISIYALQSDPVTIGIALWSAYVPTVAAIAAYGWLGISAVTIAGSVIIGEVFSAGNTDPSGGATSGSSPNYSLTAQGNRYRIGEAMTEIFGKTKVFPAYAVPPYSELENGEQYLYEIYHITNGTATIEQQKIGDTALPSNLDGFERWVLPPLATPPLFFKNIYTSKNVQRRELSSSVKKIRDKKMVQVIHDCRWRGGRSNNYYACDSRWEEKISYYYESQYTKWLSPAPNTENIIEMHIDIIGQFIGTTGATLEVEIQYQGKWDGETYVSSTKTTTAHTYSITAQSDKTTLKIPVTSGVYKVRLRRTDTKNESSSVRHELWWTGMKSVLDRPIKLKDDATYIARRTKASEITQAVRGKYSLVATRHLSTCTGFNSDGTAIWSTPKPSSSIADSVAYIAKKMLGEDELDLQQLYALDKIWQKRGDKANAIFDTTTTGWDAITKLLATGRTSPLRLWNTLTFIRDQKQDMPISLFSLANIEQGSFDVVYTLSSGEMADSIKVLFPNEDKGYTQDSVEWSEPNSPKKRVVDIRLPFITNKNQALREAKFRTREQFYRRKRVSFVIATPPRQLSYGTKHLLQYPLVSSEVGVGSIVEYNASTGVAKISTPVEFIAGQIYRIRINQKDATLSDELTIVPAILNGADNVDITDDEIQIVPDPQSNTLPTLNLVAEADLNGNASTYAIYKQAHEIKEITITELKPAGVGRVKITAIFDDDRVHAD